MIMTPLNQHSAAVVAMGLDAEPSHRLVVRRSSSVHTRTEGTVSRVAAVASALACVSSVAFWLNGSGGIGSRRAGADELLASAHFGSARAQLRAEAKSVTKQLYAAEDEDAKTGFRVAKDQALVQKLEQKAERISAQLQGSTEVKPAREMMLANSDLFKSVQMPAASTTTSPPTLISSIVSSLARY